MGGFLRKLKTQEEPSKDRCEAAGTGRGERDGRNTRAQAGPGLHLHPLTSTPNAPRCASHADRARLILLRGREAEMCAASWDLGQRTAAKNSATFERAGSQVIRRR